MKKILIIGATSTIAETTARIWAREGHRLFLVARDKERLRAMASDLKLRGAEATDTCVLDVLDFDKHESIVNKAFNALGVIDIVLIAHGTLVPQKTCEKDSALTVAQLNANAVSVISLLTHLANKFEKQEKGTIAVISSVAGDRGRPSNYVYGSAKAAVSTFCEGLEARLYKRGVHVLDIKPGFVATPMTYGLSMPAVLVANPVQVAQCIVAKIEKARSVLYVPWFWAFIMLIIRNIPRRIFRKLGL